MIGWLLTGIAASPWMQAALRYGAIVLAVLLLLLSLRQSGERVGRLAERLETTEKADDVQRRMLKAAAHRPRSATSWLTGCATAGSEKGGVAGCPPVVDGKRAGGNRSLPRRICQLQFEGCRLLTSKNLRVSGSMPVAQMRYRDVPKNACG